jgi:hypothetical protein
MKPKPKIKRTPESGSFLAYYKSEDGKNYDASGITMQEAIEEWYKNFAKKLGAG